MKKYIMFVNVILVFIIGLSWVMTSAEGKTFKIRRIIYSNFAQFFSDAGFAITNREKIGLVMKGNLISPAFRERLMLTVTSVNNCRFCSYVHSKQALLSGLSKEETEMLLKGVIDNCPPCWIREIIPDNTLFNGPTVCLCRIVCSCFSLLQILLFPPQPQ